MAEIDRRWIPVGVRRTSQPELLAGLIDLCLMLGFTVIADRLTAMGVNSFQGYLFGRPQPLADLELSWLQAPGPRQVADFVMTGAPAASVATAPK